MTKIALFAGGQISGYQKSDCYDLYVGIDGGSLYLLENVLPFDMAIGDFDSVTEAEFSNIKLKAKHLYQAPAEKDDTDTELALKHVFEQYPEADLTIFGVFGGRIDHLLSNLFIPSNPDLQRYMAQIRLKDEQNLVEYRPAGHHSIAPVEGMDYVSFMTDDEAPITILDAKYELTRSNYFKKKMYSSNEFIGKNIHVTVGSGYILIVHSKDRR